MNIAIAALMSVFMCVGAIDKAVFNGKYGYGPEFEKGLSTMGPLTVMMVGVMCVAPACGKLLGSSLPHIFTRMGSDLSVLAGALLGVDGGGFFLAKQLAKSREAIDLFGVGLSSTLGSIISFALPMSISAVDQAGRSLVARGLAAGIIAAPLGMYGVALAQGYSLWSATKMGAPCLVFSLFLAIALIFCQKIVIRLFLVFARIIVAIFVFLLVVATLENVFGVVIVPGMDPIGPQLSIVGEIGVMLAGTYPMVYFVRKHGTRVLRVMAKTLHIDELAIVGMLVSLANPLPMYMMLNNMSPRGKVLCSAMAAPVLCLLGDQLGFILAVYPRGAVPMLAGKTLAAAVALLLAIAFERLSNNSRKADVGYYS